MMGSLFYKLLTKTLECGGSLNKASLFDSGDFSQFEVEILDGTYTVTISKKEEVEEDA